MSTKVEAVDLDVPEGMHPEQWQRRVDLAAAYRLASIYGWTDLNNSHFSARLPHSDGLFLLNPFGLLFDEITASSLIEVDRTGATVGKSDYPTNPAGAIIHAAIHNAVPDAHCVLHTHSRFGAAVASQRHGLLPATQKSLTIMDFVAYHDFEGPSLRADEGQRIVDDLGDRKIMILRNHGLISVGKTVGEAFVWIYRIETACRLQIDALSGGGGLYPIPEETQQFSTKLGREFYGRAGLNEAGREWAALLRQLERKDGRGYRS